MDYNEKMYMEVIDKIEKVDLSEIPEPNILIKECSSIIQKCIGEYGEYKRECERQRTIQMQIRANKEIIMTYLNELSKVTQINLELEHKERLYALSCFFERLDKSLEYNNIEFASYCLNGILSVINTPYKAPETFRQFDQRMIKNCATLTL